MGIGKGDESRNGLSRDDIREYQEAKNRDRLESNAEYQRGKLMTKEERHRRAVDLMTKKSIDYARENGKELTESAARAYAQEVGRRHSREKE